VLLPRDPNASTVHVGIEGLEGARALIEALERTAGVAEVVRCGGERAIAIELDADALRRFGIGPAELEQAISPVPSVASLESLAKLVVKQVNGFSIVLGDLASLRVEPVRAGCRAYSDQGPSVAIGVRLNDSEARERVEAQLEAARGGELELHRYDARLHVWLSPELEPEQAVELIHRSAGSGWLLEVGVEAEPCAGPGTLARLHVSAASTIDALMEALAAVPGVLLVERPEAPRSRRWLVGPDLELLLRHGGQAGVPVGGEAKPELIVEFDREKLAAIGTTHHAAMQVIRLAHGGVEIGRMESDRELRSVVLRLGGVGDGDLAELPISAAGVLLGTVAELRSEYKVTRICRRNGERGVVSIGVASEAELPEGYRWLD
jgi:hypothetical protein